jgi:hypothetical protein
MALVAVLAFASCGVGEQDIETHTSALSTTFHRLLHDNPPTGCDTRDYSGDGDWYPNYCKTECAAAVTGMSSSFAAAGSCGFFASLVFFDPIPLDPGPGPSPEEFPHILACNSGSSPGVILQNGYTLHFGNSDDRHSLNVGYDWAPGLRKGECDSGYAITAVASDDLFHHYTCDLGLNTSSHVAYGVVGARCSALASPAGTAPTATNCQVVDFTNTSANEAGGGTSWVGADWDFGFHKGECGNGRYVKGIAHPQFGSGSARATKILCCSVQYITIPG